MRGIKSQKGFSNPNFLAAASNDFEAARQSIMNAFIDAVPVLQAKGE